MPRLDKVVLATGFMDRLAKLERLEDQLGVLGKLNDALTPKGYSEAKPNPLSLQIPRVARGSHKRHCQAVNARQQQWMADTIRKLAGNETLDEWFRRQEQEGWRGLEP